MGDKFDCNRQFRPIASEEEAEQARRELAELEAVESPNDGHLALKRDLELKLRTWESYKQGSFIEIKDEVDCDPDAEKARERLAFLKMNS